MRVSLGTLPDFRLRDAVALVALIAMLFLNACAELVTPPGSASPGGAAGSSANTGTATRPAAASTAAAPTRTPGATPSRSETSSTATSGVPRPAIPGSTDTTAASTRSAEYLIGPEDLLEIVVWKEEGLRKEVLVRPDGGISFPLIGDLQAEGKTPSALQAEITRLLSRYIPRPSVSVSLLKTASYKIYVIGKVNKPGEFTLGRPVDVLQALSLAGGLTPFASADAIRILRKARDAETSFLFDYRKVQRGMDLDQNIQLRSGDTVVVP